MKTVVFVGSSEVFWILIRSNKLSHGNYNISTDAVAILLSQGRDPIGRKTQNSGIPFRVRGMETLEGSSSLVQEGSLVRSNILDPFWYGFPYPGTKFEFKVIKIKKNGDIEW